ncbi:hypothetical protein COW53_00695 [bacterium CG17_big_fil_post_rev_8_21_14_2_50_64_8]|nr:MAG: hypothetical protein COW53_00695 [bacterium CG17_big_fil_post_rev_8_21_14_2_50_64_8]PJA74273.1 MAG: hypothetical protein CO151_10255 [bacterium CG_4_9_14_3_um_filter_65_15]
MLGVILGNVLLALNLLPPDDEATELLDAVATATERAQGLTRQLLTFAKGGAPILASRDINSIIQQASIFSSSDARSSCEFELADNLWNAEVDAEQLDQVINNLIINANQAMPDGGRISISTFNEEVTCETGLPLEPGGYIHIRIWDEGSGISPEDLPHIFDPYFTTKSTGSGLGLATSYSIVCRHGGHLSVEIFRREKQANREFAAVILDLTIPGDMGGSDVMRELLEIDPQVIGVVSSGYSNDVALANYR